MLDDGWWTENLGTLAKGWIADGGGGGYSRAREREREEKNCDLTRLTPICWGGGNSRTLTASRQGQKLANRTATCQPRRWGQGSRDTSGSHHSHVYCTYLPGLPAAYVHCSSVQHDNTGLIQDSIYTVWKVFGGFRCIWLIFSKLYVTKSLVK